MPHRQRPFLLFGVHHKSVQQCVLIAHLFHHFVTGLIACLRQHCHPMLTHRQVATLLLQITFPPDASAEQQLTLAGYGLFFAPAAVMVTSLVVAQSHVACDSDTLHVLLNLHECLAFASNYMIWRQHDLDQFLLSQALDESRQRLGVSHAGRPYSGVCCEVMNKLH